MKSTVFTVSVGMVHVCVCVGGCLWGGGGRAWRGRAGRGSAWFDEKDGLQQLAMGDGGRAIRGKTGPTPGQANTFTRIPRSYRNVRSSVYGV